MKVHCEVLENKVQQHLKTVQFNVHDSKSINIVHGN